MTSSDNPFDELLKIGQTWAKSVGLNATSTPMDPESWQWPTMSKDMMEAWLGKGVNPDGLDAKTRLLLTLLGLTLQGGDAEVLVRSTLQHLKEAEVSDQEIAETVALAGMFGGASGMTKVMTVFANIKTEQGIET